MRKKGANFLTFKGRGGRFQTDLDWRKIFLQWVIVLASQEKNQNQSRRKKRPFCGIFIVPLRNIAMQNQNNLITS